MNKLLKNRKFAYLCAVLCTMLWGTAFPVIKLGYGIMSIESDDIASKLVFAGARFLIGGVIVYIFGSVIAKKPVKMQKADIKPVALLALVQTALQYLFSYIGVGYTTAANTAIITGCMSFFVVLLSPLFFKSERLTFLKITGCIIGFAGVLAVNFSGFDSLGFSFLGEGFVLLSTLCAAAGNLITKGCMKSRSSVTVTAFQLSAGGLILLLSGFAFGGSINLASPANMLVLLYLAFVSAGAFTLWTAILRYHPVSKISVFNLLVPVFGTLWSGILLGEGILNIENLISLILVCGGILLVNLQPEKDGGGMKIEGVIFDMDGVLLDTEKLYVRFWCEAANFYGYNMQERHALAIRSLARPFAIERLKGYFGQDFDYCAVHDKRIELMDKYIEENGIETKPGALDTLKYLKEHNYKIALATATGAEKTVRYLKQTGLYGYFDEIVCAAMVKKGKPEPDIYLKAAELLGLSPNNCIAVEDSPNGVKSAYTAGCRVVTVPDLDLPDEETKKMTFRVAEGLKVLREML